MHANTPLLHIMFGIQRLSRQFRSYYWAVADARSRLWTRGDAGAVGYTGHCPEGIHIGWGQR